MERRETGGTKMEERKEDGMGREGKENERGGKRREGLKGEGRREGRDNGEES